MNAEFLARLAAAKTEAEEDWLLTELSLSVLSPELRMMALAAAVPHWFDADILAALQPELALQADQLYQQLQELSFVEVFPERGHNIHERTRKVMLTHLGETDLAELQHLSQRLVTYFADTEVHRVEQIYHWVVADFEEGSSQFESYITNLDHNYRRSEAELLLATLQEHIEAKRVPDTFAADLVYWGGRIHFRFYEAQDALSHYNQALGIYTQVADRLGEANTLKAIGDVLQFLDQRQQALDNYNQALGIYTQIGSRLGEANTLRAIGDVLQFLKQSQPALDNYNQALALYTQIGDRLGEAYTLKAIGDLETDPNAAMEKFQTALKTYIEIGDKYSQARILGWSMSQCYLNLNQPQAAIDALQQAIQLFGEIGYTDFIPQLENKVQEILSE